MFQVFFELLCLWWENYILNFTKSCRSMLKILGTLEQKSKGIIAGSYRITNSYFDHIWVDGANISGTWFKTLGTMEHVKPVETCCLHRYKSKAL